MAGIIDDDSPQTSLSRNTKEYNSFSCYIDGHEIIRGRGRRKRRYHVLFVVTVKEADDVNTVRRQFMDFKKLHSVLKRKFPRSHIPRLPRVQRKRYDDEYLNAKEKDLNAYLKHLLEINLIARSEELVSFLDDSSYVSEASEDEVQMLAINCLLESTEAKRVYVKKGSSFEVTLEVPEANSVVAWHFWTRKCDIGFAVTFNGVEVEQYMRCRGVNPRKGSFLATSAGRCVLTFDNSYSWVRAKRLFYRAEVLDAVDDPNFVPEAFSSMYNGGNGSGGGPVTPQKGRGSVGDVGVQLQTQQSGLGLNSSAEKQTRTLKKQRKWLPIRPLKVRFSMSRRRTTSAGAIAAAAAAAAAGGAGGAGTGAAIAADPTFGGGGGDGVGAGAGVGAAGMIVAEEVQRVKMGYLRKESGGRWKRRGGRRGWHRRWFYLDVENGLLRFFKHPVAPETVNERRPRGQLDLRQSDASISFEAPGKSQKPSPYIMKVVAGEKELRLCCSTQAEYDDWMDAISSSLLIMRWSCTTNQIDASIYQGDDETSGGDVGGDGTASGSGHGGAGGVVGGSPHSRGRAGSITGSVNGGNNSNGRRSSGTVSAGMTAVSAVGSAVGDNVAVMIETRIPAALQKGKTGLPGLTLLAKGSFWLLLNVSLLFGRLAPVEYVVTAFILVVSTTIAHLMFTGSTLSNLLFGDDRGDSSTAGGTLPLVKGEGTGVAAVEKPVAGTATGDGGAAADDDDGGGGNAAGGGKRTPRGGKRKRRGERAPQVTEDDEEDDEDEDDDDEDDEEEGEEESDDDSSSDSSSESDDSLTSSESESGSDA